MAAIIINLLAFFIFCILCLASYVDLKTLQMKNKYVLFIAFFSFGAAAISLNASAFFWPLWIFLVMGFLSFFVGDKIEKYIGGFGDIKTIIVLLPMLMILDQVRLFFICISVWLICISIITKLRQMKQCPFIPAITISYFVILYATFINL